MTNYANIVYGTDFSEHTAPAFEEAKYLAGLTGARLHIVHAIRTDVVPTEGEDTRDLETRYPYEGAEYKVLHGHEADQIIKYAEELPEPLIVVGSRGIGILTGLLGGGSICDKVVANAACPVLVVPGPKA